MIWMLDATAETSSPRAGLIVAALIAACADPVHADTARDDVGSAHWYAGVNIRPDSFNHRLRVDAGMRAGKLAATVVLDPKVLFEAKEQNTDVVVEWMFR